MAFLDRNGGTPLRDRRNAQRIRKQGLEAQTNGSFSVDLKLTTAGSGIYIKEGVNATSGAATLVGGTVVVSTTKVTANSRIYLTTQNTGGTPGFLRVSARTAGTSFTILSSNVLDTSLIAWLIIEPA